MGRICNGLCVCFLVLFSACSAKDIRNIFDCRNPDGINGFLYIPHVPRQDPLLISIARDMMLVNYNLISWQSYATITVAFPFYAIGRMVDERLHCCFYDPRHHRNINQIPKWAVQVSKAFIFAPLIALGSQTFLADTTEKRLTGRVFLETVPFVWAMKDLVKAFETNLHVRPKNELFSKYKCAYGGFPSGHMALSMYMTMFYGLRFGYRYAVPLGLCSLCTGVVLLNSNRHYLSQVVAGAGLGAMYAFASSKVVDYNKDRQLRFELSLDLQGHPAAQVSWAF